MGTDTTTRAEPLAHAAADDDSASTLARDAVHILRGVQGRRVLSDSVAEFAIDISGPGAVDLRYDAAISELMIEGVSGTTSDTRLRIDCLRGEFHVGDCWIDGPLGNFGSNALFGTLVLRAQEGRLVIQDGAASFALDLPTPSVVHYDASRGGLHARPEDGRLELRVPDVNVVDGVAQPAVEVPPGASCVWRRTGGAEAEVVDPHSPTPTIRLLEDGDATLTVEVRTADAVAVTTVLVKAPRG